MPNSRTNLEMMQVKKFIKNSNQIDKLSVIDEIPYIIRKNNNKEIHLNLSNELLHLIKKKLIYYKNKRFWSNLSLIELEQYGNLQNITNEIFKKLEKLFFDDINTILKINRIFLENSKIILYNQLIDDFMDKSIDKMLNIMVIQDLYDSFTIKLFQLKKKYIYELIKNYIILEDLAKIVYSFLIMS